MLLAEPPPTPWDLHFQVLGFPVRVHPLFWLVGLLLGFSGGGENAGIHLLIWFVALFSSILIHELGHALMMRRFGRPAHIVLYSMGGLAIEGRPSGQHEFSFEPYSGGGRGARTPNEQILISAAGPGIQLLLALLMILLIKVTGGSVEVHQAGFMPFPIPRLGGELAGNPNFTLLVAMLLWVNIYWPIINLLPIFPLDGGQIALQVFIQQDPWGGTQKALWLSVIAGGITAVLAFMGQQLFTALLFASLAVSCYMTLQQMGGGGRRPW